MDIASSAAATTRPWELATGLRDLAPRDHALVRLGQELRNAGYAFTTVTPLSHRRVLGRAPHPNPSYRDIFGWNRPFAAGDLPDHIIAALEEAEAVEAAGPKLRASVRFSTLGGQLFVHSAFPTEGADAVFFGPDTYRFARAIAQTLTTANCKPGMRLLDIGAGSGAGGLHAARLLASFSPEVWLTDINPHALRFSRINALINGVERVRLVRGDLYAEVSGTFDLIVSNPPYLVDPLSRLYRHGGGDLGAELSIRIIEEGIRYLGPGGRLLLYTGSAIVDGVDLLSQALHDRLGAANLHLSCEEIDPDVFGEELEAPPYDRADRIAVVAVTVERDD